MPVGQLPDYEQGSYGVLAAGDDSQLIQLPMLNPDVESIERTAKFELGADGTLKGDVTVLRLGALVGSNARQAGDGQRQGTAGAGGAIAAARFFDVHAGR